MKITKEQLKQIIKEELSVVMNEANFDLKTGMPISDKGRELEKQMIQKAMAAETKCLDWAKENKSEELIAASREGKFPLTPEIMKDCPYKADDESHRRLQIVRDRKDRVVSGQRPADDDYSKVAKSRRSLHDKGIYE